MRAARIPACTHAADFATTHWVSPSHRWPNYRLAFTILHVTEAMSGSCLPTPAILTFHRSASSVFPVCQLNGINGGRHTAEAILHGIKTSRSLFELPPRDLRILSATGKPQGLQTASLFLKAIRVSLPSTPTYPCLPPLFIIRPPA